MQLFHKFSQGTQFWSCVQFCRYQEIFPGDSVARAWSWLLTSLWNKNLREIGLEIPPAFPHILKVWCLIRYEKIHFNQSSSVIVVMTWIVFRKRFLYGVVPSHVYIQSLLGGPSLEAKATRA